MRTSEDLALASSADILASLAWTASHRKDNRRAHMKGLKAASAAYAEMRTAWLGRRDHASFYAAKEQFDLALDAMHEAETEPWRV